jgi:hypothetical protein
MTIWRLRSFSVVVVEGGALSWWEAEAAAA